jgi:hypothetical protein
MFLRLLDFWRQQKIAKWLDLMYFNMASQDQVILSFNIIETQQTNTL